MAKACRSIEEICDDLEVLMEEPILDKSLDLEETLEVLSTMRNTIEARINGIVAKVNDL